MTRALKRTGEFLATLGGVLVISFVLLYLLPGDPAEIFAGEEATQAEIEAVRRRMGFDGPLWVQFARYAARAVRGDLGTSIRSGRPVAVEVGSRLGPTALLAGLSLLFAGAVALVAGFIGAGRPGGAAAQALDWLGLVLLSVPVYWLGLALLLLFSLTLKVLPAGGDATIAHFVLPAAALGTHTGIATARVLRGALAEALAMPYVAAARGRGLGRARLVLVHAHPNACGPALAYFGLESGRLLGGAVLTETIFSINGVGRFIVQSIAFRDYPCVLGAVLFMACAVMAANLAADLAAARIDPRLAGA